LTENRLLLRAASGHAADKRDEFCAAVKQALR